MIEITILENGELLVPRGDAVFNSNIQKLLSELVVNVDDFNRFLSVTDSSETLFGEEQMCG